MQRSNARYIIDEIKKKVGYHGIMSSWEQAFFADLDVRTLKYGASVSDKQGDVLQRIYRKVWGSDPWVQ